MFNIILYLDPGSGSYLVQMIIAAVLAGLFFFKNLWWKIKSFFSVIWWKIRSLFGRSKNHSPSVPDLSTPKED
ncbi:MAG TPA: hypothetical protein VD993_20860 [Chitinophagaceae bacterium]|nr:hypothetical protein [Chitinophagaceae bacterium]